MFTKCFTICISVTLFIHLLKVPTDIVDAKFPFFFSQDSIVWPWPWVGYMWQTFFYPFTTSSLQELKSLFLQKNSGFNTAISLRFIKRPKEVLRLNVIVFFDSLLVEIWQKNRLVRGTCIFLGTAWGIFEPIILFCIFELCNWLICSEIKNFPNQ